MNIRIRKSSFIRALICLYILTCTIPNIANNGFNIGGINVSVVDFFAMFIIYMLIINGDLKRMLKDLLSIDKGIFTLCIIILCYMLIYGLISFVINDIVAIRIIRNIFSVFFDYFTIYYLFYYLKMHNIISKLIGLSMILSIATIYVYLKKYDSLGEYALFRSNETILVSLLMFFVFYIFFNKIKLKKHLLLISSFVLILISIVVQQERTQLLAIFFTCSIMAVINLFKKNIKSNIVFIFKITLIFTILFLLFYYIYNNNEFFYGLINNYIYNRLNIIFDYSGFHMDTSLSIRNEEIKVISNLLSTNNLNLFLGKGLGAHYYVFGIDMFVVDTFWGWIFLNMGIIGMILYVVLFGKLLINLLNIKQYSIKMPLLAFFTSTIVMTLFTPNFIWRIDDGVSFGLLMALILRFRLFTISEKT